MVQEKVIRKIDFRFWTGVIIVSVLGILFHFVYEWSGSNYAVGLIAPKDESVMEHLKLLWFPFLVYSIIEFFVYGHSSKFLISRFIGLLCGLAFIPIMFYLQIWIFGEHFAAVNIAIYLVSVWLSFFVSKKI